MRHVNFYRLPQKRFVAVISILPARFFVKNAHHFYLYLKLFWYKNYYIIPLVKAQPSPNQFRVYPTYFKIYCYGLNTGV